ncbi:MAG: septum formation initiator family protein [Bacteroidia bacterium]|nr:septum formation initiator family protein [Bacteroidia bacterium]
MLQLWNKYKYWVVGVTALVWMTIFDSNNFIELIRLRSDLSDLREKRSYYKSEIIKARKTEKDLFSNNKNLEKFARERYLMKKDNEDIFIIVEPENN